LNWLQQNRPQLFARLEYVILEPSAPRQEWQRETLKRFAPCVRWLAELPPADSLLLALCSSTVLFTNELLDAFPVHRLGWNTNEKQWFEWGVAVDGEQFIWTQLPVSDSRFTIHASPELLTALPHGYTIEVSPAAEAWYRRAADSLVNGKFVTIDYGQTADEMFQPGRLNGTLRAYHRHQVSDNLLANVGDQDLTAHVNFSALKQSGEAAGLRTETFQTQSQFLTAITAKMWQDPAAAGGWTPAQTRQFQTLTHPEHLGRAFRVLVQSR
jgi:SAM-dependent MidA family methyltransferase